MKIVIVNGYPRSGKSLFVKCCLAQLTGYGREVSTVDYVKDIAASCGWDGEKNPKNRKFLSDLKDLLTEWNDLPYKKIEEVYNRSCSEALRFDKNLDKSVLFIHCREPQEIQKIKDRLGGVSLLIRRAVVENDEQSNHADAEVLNCKYDYEIDNNGDLKKLNEEAKSFLDKINIKS